jgi:hypothetical protein
MVAAMRASSRFSLRPRISWATQPTAMPTMMSTKIRIVLTTSFG